MPGAHHAAPESEPRSSLPKGAWGFYLIAGLATAVLFVALPAAGWGQRALMPAVTMITAIVIVIAVRTHQPPEPGIWWKFASSFVLYSTGSTLYLTNEFGFLTPASLVLLAAYLLQVVARVDLVRLRLRGARSGFWLDAGLIMIAGTLFSYVAFIRPYQWTGLSDIAGFLASFGWPMVGTFLLILTLMLSLSFGRRPAAFWLLLASMTAQLMTDIVYANSVIAGADGFGDFFAGYLVFSTFLGAAALHPSMRSLTDRHPGEGLLSSNPLRIPSLGSAVLAPLIMVLIGELMEVELPIVLIAVTGVVLVILMTIRVASTMRSLQSADVEKTRFLDRMSHELRTPLSSVLSFSELLEVEQPLTPSQRENVQYILGAGRHLLDLVDDLLDVSRVERGEISLSIEWLPIEPLLKEVVALMEPAAASHGITLRASVDEVQGETVWADPVRLKQILLNLLSNAIKFNRPKGLVEVSASIDGQTVIVEVRDTGFGLKETQVARLFVAFERLDVGTRVEGTGLGLALSKRLAEAMGTDIHVVSEPGKGTRFTLELKRGERMAAPSAADATAPSQALETTRPRGGRRILFIDDNLPMLKAVEKISSLRNNIDLATARDAATGIAAARREPPDLILLDLSLPDMPGLEALRELRSFPSTHDIPVVIVTADTYAEREEDLRHAGASGYLKKPFRMADLLEAIDIHLAGRNRTIT